MYAQQCIITLSFFRGLLVTHKYESESSSDLAVSLEETQDTITAVTVQIWGMLFVIVDGDI